MEFEFNFGEQQLTPGQPRDNTLYASVDGIAQPLDQDELVFMDYETGQNHVMTLQVLQAMGLTQQFRPMHEHIQQIAAAIPELKNQQQAIEKVLRFLKDKRLIISADDWLNQLKHTKAQKDNRPYAGMVVRTCDRPEQLNRLLDSLNAYQQKHGSEHPVLVFDDSKNADNRSANEKICQKAAVHATYHGESWQQQFIAMLLKEWPQHEQSIKWLLQKRGGFTGGRVWNLALLALAGKRFVFFDDDYLMQARMANDVKPDEINLSDEKPLSVQFGLNVRDIKQKSAPYDKDLLQEMVEACGQSFGEWLSAHPHINSSSLYGLRLMDLNRIAAQSTIKTTGNGTWGSPRAAGNYWLYLLKKEQREAFWQNRETYLDNIEASQLLHYSDHYQVLSQANFAPSSIDNSEFLPFTMPTETNEDYFFGGMTEACYPDNVSLQFPVMLGHLQTEDRERSQFNHIARRPGINSFVADYVTSVAHHFFGCNPIQRFESTRAALADLMENPDHMLLNRLREYLSRTQAQLIHQLQSVLAEVDNPPIYWQADVKELIEANGAAIKSNDVPRLGGWPKDLDADSCVKKLRAELSEIIKAMEVWPELWDFCRAQ
ncbi:hypothetical protein GCM10011365_11630 [Marinicella pacifica]|uniref:Uncharacterized protein n=1 Tax=Marinicella pacifica TaxID=1171543 RepID=A0A917CNL6_9GAMM|nr:hypothetical protein [Marinicella pacifica]GGF92088.1 hypothetical protein GCM10011365_11630 [Marinicella pacifica]